MKLHVSFLEPNTLVCNRTRASCFGCNYIILQVEIIQDDELASSVQAAFSNDGFWLPPASTLSLFTVCKSDFSVQYCVYELTPPTRTRGIKLVLIFPLNTVQHFFFLLTDHYILSRVVTKTSMVCGEFLKEQIRVCLCCPPPTRLFSFFLMQIRARSLWKLFLLTGWTLTSRWNETWSQLLLKTGCCCCSVKSIKDWSVNFPPSRLPALQSEKTSTKKLSRELAPV